MARMTNYWDRWEPTCSPDVSAFSLVATAEEKKNQPACFCALKNKQRRGERDQIEIYLFARGVILYIFTGTPVLSSLSSVQMTVHLHVHNL